MASLAPAWLRAMALLALLLGAAAATHAQTDREDATSEAVAQPYRARVAPTGNAELDALLTANSGLIALQERAPTDAEGVRARMAAEPERLRPALESEGYWAAQVTVIAESGGPPQPVLIRVDTGPRYVFRRIETRGASPIPLQPGQPARAAEVLSAQEAALAALRAEARPLARIERAVTVDHAARAMDVVFTATPGPRADFASPSVEGTQRVDPEVVRRVAALRLAERSFSPARIARARADINALGPFSSVRIDTGAALDPEGRLPVTVVVRERPFRALSASAAYETNFGLALRGAWEHRNLLGGAENLRIELEASRLGEAFDRTNGRAEATWRQPLPFGFDGTLVGSLAFLRERLDSYDRDAVVLGLLYERRLSDRWTVSTGPVAEAGSTGPPGETLSAYQIAGFTMQARYDSTDSLLDPRRGIRATGSVTPSYAFAEATAFAPLRLAASTYIDLTGDGRSILALRGALGSLLNASAETVPQSQRFFAGGGGSVRGYDFRSIGPRDSQNRPVGGASLVEGSIEFRQRFGASYGAAIFVDAGGVGTSAAAPTDSLRVGAGVGLRYYTAIGPIRADVAVPLVRQEGSGAFGFYVGIGHAF